MQLQAWDPYYFSPFGVETKLRSYSQILEINKQVILAFTFDFIVYRTVAYVFERLFKPSETAPNILKS